MSAPTDLSLDQIFVSLIEMGHGQRAVPVLEQAVQSLVSRPENATGNFELEDLLNLLRVDQNAKVADLTVAAIDRIVEERRRAESRSSFRLGKQWKRPSGEPPVPYADRYANPKELFYEVAHAHEGSSEVRRARYAPIAELIRPGERVVDIGCGDGTFLELVRDRGAVGVGIDVDPDKVAAVRDKGIEAHCGRAQELAWDWGSVDFVNMIHIVEHIPSDEMLQILDRACRSLSDRGRLFVLTPNISHPTVQVNFWLDITHVRPYPELILGTMMEALGFPFYQSGSMTHDLETWCYGFKHLQDGIH